MSLMRPLTSIRSEFDRLFSDLEREFLPMAGWRTSDGESMMSMWAPPVNIEETENELMVTASVPGLRPEDINVEVEGRTLTISGESRQETEKTDRNVHRREIVQGKFYRQVQLPIEVDGDQAKARFEHGMLEVTIPKAPQSRRHKIEIAR